MRRIVLDVDLFGRDEDRDLSERALVHALEVLTLADEAYLRRNPGTPDLYRAGVRYQAEPIPQEQWKAIPYVLRDKHGDCEDLAAWRVASYRVRGIAARPTFIWRKVGQVKIYHILVELPNGTIEDPSRILGMGEIA